MDIVKCDHCGIEVDKNNAVPCTWKEFDLTWYYCKRCNEGVFGGLKVKNEEVIDKLKMNNDTKSFTIHYKI